MVKASPTSLNFFSSSFCTSALAPLCRSKDTKPSTKEVFSFQCKWKTLLSQDVFQICGVRTGICPEIPSLLFIPASERWLRRAHAWSKGMKAIVLFVGYLDDALVLFSCKPSWSHLRRHFCQPQGFYSSLSVCSFSIPPVHSLEVACVLERSATPKESGFSVRHNLLLWKMLKTNMLRWPGLKDSSARVTNPLGFTVK